MALMKSCKFSSIMFRILFGLLFNFVVMWSVNGLSPIENSPMSMGDEWLQGMEEHELGPYSSWNITGTYRGNWKFIHSTNDSSKFPYFRKSNGYSLLELKLISTLTETTGVHYVQGDIIFRDMFHDEHDAGVAQITVEGVYIWLFRQIRLVTSSGIEGESGQEDDSLLSDINHLESHRELFWKRKPSPINENEKHCNIEIAAQVSQASSKRSDGDHGMYHLEGLMQSPSVGDDVNCFSPTLLNATSVNTEVYHRKAMNFSLMVTFITLIQIKLLKRQMQHSNTHMGAAKVSLLMIGNQAIMDVYICFLLLIVGILVGPLFNALAPAAFIKFSLVSIYEMRYLLVIWTANQIMNYGEDWEPANDDELSPLYSSFYKFLFGGALVMILFHKYLWFILLLLHSFWIPQIIINITHDLRKPLHPYYTIGMTITRVVIPLYAYGCPHNFLRIEPAKNWCISLIAFMGLQASLLLVQHYFGSRVFVPSQFFPGRYNYYRRSRRGYNPAVECVICMRAIHLRQRWNTCMVTPCEHFFHSHCLNRWMDIKMECPTCRGPLPPP